MHEQILFQDEYIAEMGICNILVTFDNCDNITNTVPKSPKPFSVFIHQSTAHILPKSSISTSHFEGKFPTISQATPSYLNDKSLPTSSPTPCSIISDKSNTHILQNSSFTTTLHETKFQHHHILLPTLIIKLYFHHENVSPVKSVDHGNQHTSPTSSKGTNLPFNEFLSLSNVIQILLDDNNASLKEITYGKKENVYFVIGEGEVS